MWMLYIFQNTEYQKWGMFFQEILECMYNGKYFINKIIWMLYILKYGDS